MSKALLSSVLYLSLLILLFGCGELKSIVVKPTDIALPRLKVSGNRIVDADGKPIVLKGLNAGDIIQLKWDGHWSEQYFKEAAGWGAKIVRLIVHPGHYKKYGAENTYILLDQALEWCGKYGLYAIIDWHSVGNIVSGHFLENNEAYITTKEEMKSFWKTVAGRYKNNTTAAFFELFNEPGPIFWQGDTMKWSDWRSVADEMMDTILESDPAAVPVVAGLGFCTDLRSVKVDPFRHKNIVLAAHTYPGNMEEPLESRWEDYFGYLSKDYPLMITEMGFDPDDAVYPKLYKAGADFGRRAVKFAKQRNISWTAFVFYRGEYWPMPLFESWKTFKPTPSGAFFKNELINAAGY